MKDTVCIYSGGMDSYTLAALTLREGRLAACLSFDYGQRHKKELEYAAANCAAWEVDHHIIRLDALQGVFLGSALLNQLEMPHGHYASENMKQTVVPNRNMIMLSIAIAFAASRKLKVVRYGAHSGDHTIYPDCRAEFTAAMNHAAHICDWSPVTVEAPFQYLDKAQILEQGFALGLDYSRSWTCYEGGLNPCGKCGSCQERLDAFRMVGRYDPLPYVTRELLT